jgi:hypothetical protein
VLTKTIIGQSILMQAGKFAIPVREAPGAMLQVALSGWR